MSLREAREGQLNDKKVDITQEERNEEIKESTPVAVASEGDNKANTNDEVPLLSSTSAPVVAPSAVTMTPQEDQKEQGSSSTNTNPSTPPRSFIISTDRNTNNPAPTILQNSISIAPYTTSIESLGLRHRIRDDRSAPLNTQSTGVADDLIDDNNGKMKTSTRATSRWSSWASPSPLRGFTFPSFWSIRPPTLPGFGILEENGSMSPRVDEVEGGRPILRGGKAQNGEEESDAGGGAVDDDDDGETTVVGSEDGDVEIGDGETKRAGADESAAGKASYIPRMPRKFVKVYTFGTWKFAINSYAAADNDVDWYDNDEAKRLEPASREFVVIEIIKNLALCSAKWLFTGLAFPIWRFALTSWFCHCLGYIIFQRFSFEPEYWLIPVPWHLRGWLSKQWSGMRRWEDRNIWPISLLISIAYCVLRYKNIERYYYLVPLVWQLRAYIGGFVRLRQYFQRYLWNRWLPEMVLAVFICGYVANWKFGYWAVVEDLLSLTTARRESVMDAQIGQDLVRHICDTAKAAYR